MSKFTQGEWVYDEFSAIVKTVSNNSRPICIVIEEGEDDYSEEDDTNGRLIAAAPKMYRLLKVLSSIDEPVNEERFDDLLLAVDEARKVLSRIDGEEAEYELHQREMALRPADR